MTLSKAVLSDNKGHRLEVQFNPETLTITHQTFGQEGRQRVTAESQRGGEVAAGEASNRTAYSSTLSQLDLFFDTSDSGQDVRENSLLLAEMMKPVDNESPMVTFQWGTLLFAGHITSFTETLSYFSEQGVPLRATMNISLTAASSERSANSVTRANSGLGLSASASLGVSAGVSVGASVGGSIGASVAAGLSAGGSIGTTPLTFSQSGESLQSLSARAGLDWRAVAEANNIDNPRTLQTGAVVNLQVGT